MESWCVDAEDGRTPGTEQHYLEKCAGRGWLSHCAAFRLGGGHWCSGCQTRYPGPPT